MFRLAIAGLSLKGTMSNMTSLFDKRSKGPANPSDTDHDVRSINTVVDTDGAPIRPATPTNSIESFAMINSHRMSHDTLVEIKALSPKSAAQRIRWQAPPSPKSEPFTALFRIDPSKSPVRRFGGPGWHAPPPPESPSSSTTLENDENHRVKGWVDHAVDSIASAESLADPTTDADEFSPVEQSGKRDGIHRAGQKLVIANPCPKGIRRWTTAVVSGIKKGCGVGKRGKGKAGVHTLDPEDYEVVAPNKVKDERICGDGYVEVLN